MNGQEHDRAIDLLTLRDVEGISDAEAQWLEMHLEECADCAGFDRAMSGAAQAVRSLTVMASAALIDATRGRVHNRAEQLREQQARSMLMAVSFCLGVVTSTLTAWVWWELGGWLAAKLGLPSGIVEPGVLLFWLLPAVAIAVLLVTYPPTLFEGSLIERYMKDHSRGMQ